MTLEFFCVPNVPEIASESLSGVSLGAVLAASARAAGIEILNRDIVAIAQKIVSKAEGRMVRLGDVTPSDRARALARQMSRDPRLIETILGESRRIVRARGDVLICETHHGFICANAGVDRSNVDGGETVTLLPVDPDRSARRLARQLGCGILITDTFGRAWREGLLDVTIGLAGLPPFIDYRGTADRHGYPLRASVLAAADALAAAAGLTMGKTAQTPMVVIRGFSWTLAEVSAQSLLRPKERDLFL